MSVLCREVDFSIFVLNIVAYCVSVVGFVSLFWLLCLWCGFCVSVLAFVLELWVLCWISSGLL